VWKPRKLVYNTRLITYRINDKRTSLIPTNRVSECALGKIFGVFRLIEVHCALGIHPLVMNDDNIVFLTNFGRTPVAPKAPYTHGPTLKAWVLGNRIIGI
jgi:hypothetical protein